MEMREIIYHYYVKQKTVHYVKQCVKYVSTVRFMLLQIKNLNATAKIMIPQIK